MQVDDLRYKLMWYPGAAWIYAWNGFVSRRGRQAKDYFFRDRMSDRDAFYYWSQSKGGIILRSPSQIVKVGKEKCSLARSCYYIQL